MSQQCLFSAYATPQFSFTYVQHEDPEFYRYFYSPLSGFESSLKPTKTGSLLLFYFLSNLWYPGLLLALFYKVNFRRAPDLSLECRAQRYSKYTGPYNEKNLQHFTHKVLIKVNTAAQRKYSQTLRIGFVQEHLSESFLSGFAFRLWATEICSGYLGFKEAETQVH